MFITPFISALIITFLSTPLAAKFFFKRGIYGVDLHKEGEIKIPEMTGTAIFFSLLVVLVYYYLGGSHDLLAPIFGIYIIGTLGIIDGFLRLSAAQKIASFTLVGIFLAWGIGFRGVIVSLMIGVLFMAAVNFTNMLAGFNGLEIGTGAIAALGISGAAYYSGETQSLIISSATAGALLGFLYYNRFPAKVFPGDVGTLIIGAALFSSILIGKLYVAGFLVFIPYVIDAGLKFFSAGVMTRESQKPTLIKEGRLHMPEGSNLSLPRVFLRKRGLTEKEVVLRVWTIEVLFSASAIVYEVVL